MGPWKESCRTSNITNCCYLALCWLLIFVGGTKWLWKIWFVFAYSHGGEGRVFQNDSCPKWWTDLDQPLSNGSFHHQKTEDGNPLSRLGYLPKSLLGDLSRRKKHSIHDFGRYFADNTKHLKDAYDHPDFFGNFNGARLHQNKALNGAPANEKMESTKIRWKINRCKIGGKPRQTQMIWL